MPTEFQEKVYRTISKIPKGKVSTYKLVGKALGTKAYRAVGQALRCNPYAPKVPCHRVVASDGSMGGFRGKRTGLAITEKISILQKEGVEIKNKRIADFEKVLFNFKK